MSEKESIIINIMFFLYNCLKNIKIVVLYSIVSFKNGYYGEVIIYLCIMLPMYITGIISWIRHQNKETNDVKGKKLCYIIKI